MGLFAKRPPCPICGGKVKGLLTWKVGGEKVCDDCYGFVDLPDKMVDNMSIEEFKQYMVFRDENDVLRQEFQETQRIDFGWLDTKFLFDMPHRYLCMDKHLKKTIFEGGQIKSFVIREDSMPLYEGSANGLRKHESGVPAQVAAMAPQIQQLVSQKQFQRNMERLVDQLDDGKRNHSTGYYDDFVDIAAPFKNFILEIRFDHPYWKTFTADTPRPHLRQHRAQRRRLLERLPGKSADVGPAGNGPHGHRFPRRKSGAGSCRRNSRPARRDPHGCRCPRHVGGCHRGHPEV